MKLVCGSISSFVVLPGLPKLTFVAVTLELANCVDSASRVRVYRISPVNPVMIVISWLAAAAAATVAPGYVHMPPERETEPVAHSIPRWATLDAPPPRPNACPANDPPALTCICPVEPPAAPPPPPLSAVHALPLHRQGGGGPAPPHPPRHPHARVA